MHVMHVTAPLLTNPLVVPCPPFSAAMSFVEEVGREINRTPLAQLIDEKQYAVRYPQVRDPFCEGPDPVTGLLQRTYTLVPASSSASGAGTNNGDAAPVTAAATSAGSSVPGAGNTQVFQQMTMALVVPEPAKPAPTASAFK
jgi:hypothetical protein